MCVLTYVTIRDPSFSAVNLHVHTHSVCSEMKSDHARRDVQKEQYERTATNYKTSGSGPITLNVQAQCPVVSHVSLKTLQSKLPVALLKLK